MQHEDVIKYIYKSIQRCRYSEVDYGRPPVPTPREAHRWKPFWSLLWARLVLLIRNIKPCQPTYSINRTHLNALIPKKPKELHVKSKSLLVSKAPQCMGIYEAKRRTNYIKTVGAFKR